MAAAKRNQKKQSAKNGKRLPILLVLVLIIGIVTYFRDDIPFIKSVPTDGSVSVYFLDVGQGDSDSLLPIRLLFSLTAENVPKATPYLRIFSSTAFPSWIMSLLRIRIPTTSAD